MAREPRRAVHAQPSRRDVLGAASGGLIGVALVGCDALSTQPEGSAPAGVADPDAKEAPALAEQVSAGDVPPLTERMPDTPMVVEPLERVGTYGGEWHSALLGPTDYQWLYRTIGYDQLMRWDLDFTEPLPNLAESVDVGVDGREFVIHLRAGVKWSDGEPFTADDVLFAYDAVAANTDLYPAPPSWLVTGGELATFEKIDDTTVRVAFAEPAAFFLSSLATADGELLVSKPKHYLAEFHVEHNSEAGSLADAEGYADWIELFGVKSQRWENAEMPTLGPWRIVTALGKGTRVVAERNPYYWKVDTDGRQLPYIDSVTYDVVEDDQVILLKATNGEIDLHTRHINTLANKPVLARSRESGDYRLLEMVTAWSNYMSFALNQVHKDPVKREIFANKDFRIGLSYAINRDELIKTVFQRQGEPNQVGPRPESEYYDEQLAKQYTEFDVDKATEHLDRAGYSERDEQGRRLGPDGKPISFTVNVIEGAGMLVTADDVEFVKGYWADVGIEMRVRTMDVGLWVERNQANEHDAVVHTGAQAMADAILTPMAYFPYHANVPYAVPWVNWYHGAEPSEEPSDAAKRQMAIYDEIKVTMDVERRNELFRELLEITREEFYLIGTALPVGAYGIVKNDFHNVYEPMIEAFAFVTPGPSMPEQYFIEQS